MKLDNEELIQGTKDWLTETVLHGPKYFVGTRIWTKLIWGICLLGCFIYAMTILIGSAQDWSDNPVVTSIDTVEAPTKDIPFPSITACKKMPRYHQPWELPEMIFNFFALSNCSSDCNKHQVSKMVGVFKNFINNVLDNYIENGSGGAASSGFFLLLPPYKGLKLAMLFSQAYCDLAKKIRELWDSNPNLIEELKDQWKTAVTSSEQYTLDTLMNQYNVQINFSDFTINDVINDGTTLLKGDKPQARTVSAGMENFRQCEVKDGLIWKFLVQVYRFNQDIFFANFGSTLKILLGNGKLDVIPFKYEWKRGTAFGDALLAHKYAGKYADGCLEETDEDRYFHGILKAVSKEFNSQVSIFDIPKLFNPNLPPPKGDNTLRPSYSLCEINSTLNRNEVFLAGGDNENCFFAWSDTINSYDQSKQNPYNNADAKICARGLSDAIGIDPKNLMLIMKFAYFFADMDDVKTLYNRIQKAQLMVPIKPLAEIQSSLDLPKPLAISNYLENLHPGNQFQTRVKHDLENWKGIVMSSDIDNENETYALDFQPFITSDFRPTITDYGLCSSYNSLMEIDVFNQDSVTNFHEVFHRDHSNVKSLKMGGDREYTFMLDTQERRNYPFNVSDASNYVVISINSPEEFYNVMQDNINVEGGTEMIIRVQPVGLVSDEDVATVPLEKRNCRMKSEIPESMPMFQEYTRKACLFNCMYDFSLQECQCYPWNFPEPVGKNKPICTFYGNECFYKKFQNTTYLTSQCDCLPGCDSINYKYQIDTIRKITEKEAEKFCIDRTPHHEYVRHTEKAYRELKNIDDPELAYDSLYEYEQKRCQNYLREEFAFITIRLEGSSYLRRVQSLNYKFFDKISIVGGTLGLFSGFSIIFVFEVIYWFIVTVKKAIKFRKNGVNAQPAQTEVEWKTSELIAKIIDLEEEIEKINGIITTSKGGQNSNPQKGEDKKIEEVEDQTVIEIE